MRILFVLNAYEEDGPGLLITRLCQRLAGMDGLHVATASIGRDGPLADRLRHLGIPTEFVPSRSVAGFRQLVQWAGQLAARPDCPHLIHTNLLWPDIALRLVRKHLPRVPLISTCHGLHASSDKGPLASLGYRAIEHATRSRCDGWIAVSRSVQQAMLRDHYPPEKVHLVPNGIDCLAFHPFPTHRRLEIRRLMALPPQALVLVSVGTLRPLKGHDVLLRALPGIRAELPETRLVLVGEGPARAELEKLATELGVADMVRFIGPLSALLPQVFAAADVAVHPSRIEAFGLVVAEAQACGIPVVASRVGGIPETLQEGETGLLVPPDDPGALAEALLSLLKDPERRQRMGAAARQYVHDHHEISATAEGYLAVWKQLTGRDPDKDTVAYEEEEKRLQLDTSRWRLGAGS